MIVETFHKVKLFWREAAESNVGKQKTTNIIWWYFWLEVSSSVASVSGFSPKAPFLIGCWGDAAPALDTKYEIDIFV